MDNVISYKCPACSAPLAFDPGSGKLLCGSCGNSYDVTAIEALNTESTQFNWGDYKAQVSQGTLEDTVTYTCRSCGAEIETDRNTAATHCPYCDNEVVLSDRVGGSLRPNVILPFKIGPKELGDVVERFSRGKRLLPKNFFTESRISKVQGMYVPFWLFDCRLEGSVELDGRRVRTYRRGDYECTETSHYLIDRAGGMDFSNVPVDGSEKMDNDLMDSLEPFDFGELVDFDPAYLSGYLADRFDRDPDAELGRAGERMTNSVVDVFTGTASGYADLSVRSSNVGIADATVKYALLPVYLLNCEYGGKKYRYAVNGQTGKVVGELPTSKQRKRRWFFGIFAVTFAVVFAVLSALLLR